MHYSDKSDVSAIRAFGLIMQTDLRAYRHVQTLALLIVCSQHW